MRFFLLLIMAASTLAFTRTIYRHASYRYDDSKYPYHGGCSSRPPTENTRAHLLRLAAAVLPEKSSFVGALDGTLALSVERFPSRTALLDELVEKLIEASQSTGSNRMSNIQQKATGTWKVQFAPHINTLEKLLLTTFEVTYTFPPSSSARDAQSIDRPLLSNARYHSRLFGSGHLNTSGRYSIVVGDSDSVPVCKIVWDCIWWDLESAEAGPSSLDEVSKHVMAGVIQTVGKLSFVESVSVFPLQYLDDDLCVFLFKLFGTRICARKI